MVFFGVAGDGNPTSIIGPNGAPIDAAQLAVLIQNSGWQPGQPIQLFACFTGAPTGTGSPDIAEQLAGILHTLVIAPSTFGWVSPNGSFTIAPANDPSLDYSSPPALVNASQPNTAAPGHWNFFMSYPYTGYPPSSPSVSFINQLLNMPSGSGVFIK